jgi:hypothetical protein
VKTDTLLNARKLVDGGFQNIHLEIVTLAPSRRPELAFDAEHIAYEGCG